MLTEVDSRTMRSNIFTNLFIAGELLDRNRRIGGYNFQSDFSRRRWKVRMFEPASRRFQRLPARNFSIAEGSGDSICIASPETGCSKPSDFACNATRLRIHRGCMASFVL